MARQMPVGSDLYLFHGDEGRSEYLVISSHGQTLKSKFTAPGGVTLLFYAPPDHVLTMHANFRLGIRVEERVEAGSVSTDYELSKFQGAKRGGGTETYGRIMASIDHTRRLIRDGVQTWPQHVAAAGPLPAGFNPQFLETTYKSHVDAATNLLPMDVLTIRAKGMRQFGFGGVKLSTVLRTLKAQGIFYPYIFCSFCRYTPNKQLLHRTVEY